MFSIFQTHEPMVIEHVSLEMQVPGKGTEEEKNEEEGWDFSSN